MHYLDDAEVLEACRSSDIYNILLYRRDIFQAALSLSITEYTGEHVLYTQDTGFDIKQADLEKSIDFYIGYLEKLNSNYYKLDFAEVFAFEDLTFNEDTDFHSTLLSDKFIRKVKKSPDKKRITNYNELYEFSSKYLNGKTTWDFK